MEVDTLVSEVTIATVHTSEYVFLVPSCVPNYGKILYCVFSVLSDSLGKR